MNKPRIIPRPDIEGTHPLSAPELNRIRFSDKRTILTPELLEKMAGKSIKVSKK